MSRLRLGLAVFLFAAASTPALAQSAINGQVRDNTGAVLPGVTVEVASPAIIEGTRSVVSDGQGRYSVVELRPGTYTVTFTLTGFSRVIREGIQLPSNFTATVDATMNVGALEESITVSGEAPVVDVTQVSRTQVLNSQALESIVNSGSIWTQGALLSGVQMTGVDVGGSQYSSDLQLAAHGASSIHSLYMVDGLPVQNIQSDGGDSSNYYAEVSNLEVTIGTSGATAESSVGGLRMNRIPRDGGNAFSGTAYAGESHGAWQGDNLTQRLQDMGVVAVDKIHRIFDYSATVGGPIVRDRLWFHFSIREWGNQLPQANNFYNDGRQYIRNGDILAIIPRLTYQVTPRNKVTAHLERQGKRVGPKINATYPAVILEGQRGSDPETATTWNYPSRPYGSWQTKWTSTVSNRLLLETGYSRTFILDGYPPPEGAWDLPVGSPEWYSRVASTDLNRGVSWNSAPWFMRWAYQSFITSSLSYVTGSHNFKVGIQNSWGKTEYVREATGDIQQIRYRSGVPDSVVVGNYPLHEIPKLKYDLGLYAQDSWRIDRLTLNGGLRFEWLNAHVPEQVAAPGRFVGLRSFAPVEDVPNFGLSVSPRIGVSYDVFGDSKTAVKFSFGRYMRRHTTDWAARLNPMAAVFQALPWNDRDIQGGALPTNNDRIVQDNELDLTRLPANYGEAGLDHLDPGILREYNLETAASLQHQLWSNVSLNLGWYRRSFHNRYIDDNLLRSFDDYAPVEVVSPYNGEVFTVYNLKSAASLSRIDTLITNSKDNREVYNGFEVGVDARLPGGVIVLASSTTQRSRTNNCDQRDDPNLLRFCNRFDLPSPYNGVDFKSDLKLSGSYPLPWWNIRVSGTFSSNPGSAGQNALRDEIYPINWRITRTTRYTEAQCAGRPCTAGALVVPNLVETNLVVPLAPAGTERVMERQNQLNFGVRKPFRLGRFEYSAEFDLYNALNADFIYNFSGNDFGTSAFDVPSAIVAGRIPRLAVRMKW
jgi:hypothetical protein